MLAIIVVITTVTSSLLVNLSLLLLARSLYDMNVLHMQGACMAAQLVAACFLCSLVHPQRAVDFATYTPLELWEGTHLFHDPYKYDPTCLAPVQLCETPMPA